MRRLRMTKLRILPALAFHLIVGAVAAGGCAFMAGPARAQEPDTSLWVTDGPVHAIVGAGNTIYIGGRFSYVGPPTGSFVGIDAVTGGALPPIQRVAGTVGALAPDGSGGWYLGGTFWAVLGEPRDGLAHIDACGRLTAWNPDVSGSVETLAMSGGVLYAGGSFTDIAGQPRNRLAAFDVATGALTAWNPGANQTVYAITEDGGTVYACGSFTSVGGQPRNRLAAIDVATGTVTAWDPNADGAVFAVQVRGSLVYVGGPFSNVGGQPRHNLASLDRTTGAVTSWNPSALDLVTQVYSLAADGTTIYATGYTDIAGQGGYGVVALDAGSGTTLWKLRTSAPTYSLLRTGTALYAGGQFTTIGGQSRRHLAQLDPATGAVASWDPMANQSVFALAASGGMIWAGGAFTSAGGVARNCAAALDATTGAATSWNPDASGGSPFNQEPTAVLALVVSGGTVYAGGRFTAIGGEMRHALAALDPTTGAATAWNPDVQGDVYDLSAAGGTIYAAGEFATVGGQDRICIAAIDAASGAPTSWNPTSDNTVYTLAVDGATVYAGGEFLSIGGQTRHGLAALDVSTGLATAWNPDAGPYYPIYDLAMQGGSVYAAGTFSTIGGQLRSGLAAIDAASGTPQSWNPNPNPFTYALALDGDLVYVGGSFNVVGGNPRRHLAAIDRATGFTTSWNPAATSTWYPIEQFGIMSLAVIGDHVYAGGDFMAFGPWAQSHVARFPRTLTLDVRDGSAAGGLRLAAWPNPFSGRSTLSFTLPGAADVEVRIQDIEGRLVRVLTQGRLEPGTHRLAWDGRDRNGHQAPQGVYLATLASGVTRASAKVVKLQ